MVNTQNNNNEKLSELKNKIDKERTELLKQMLDADSRKDTDNYEYLEKCKLQCDAEIRLINHITNGFKDEFIMH